MTTTRLYVDSQPGGTPYASLQAALAALSTTTRNVSPITGDGNLIHLDVPTNVVLKVDENTTIPENVSLSLPAGSTIDIANGVSLTVHGRIEAGPYPIFTFSGTGAIASGSTFKRTDALLPQWFGVVGDGTANDTTPFRRCLEAASAADKSIFLHSATAIRTVNVLWMYGAASIVGESREACEIILDGDCGAADGSNPASFDAAYRAYWFVLGMTSKPVLPSAAGHELWTGRLAHLSLRCTSNAVASHILQLQYTDNFLIEDVAIDISGMGASAATSALSAIVTGNGWTTSPSAKRGSILGVRIRSTANASGGPVGIDLEAVDDCYIGGNHIGGPKEDSTVRAIGGDAIVLKGLSRHNHVVANLAYSTQGGIGVLGTGEHNTFIANYVERAEGADGWLSANADLYFALADSASATAPRGTIFAANQAHLPSGPSQSSVQVLLNASGAQDSVIQGNVLRGDASVGGVGLAVVRTGTHRPGSTTHKPKNLALVGNVCCGTKPASIDEALAASTSITDLEGPVVYEGNIAGGYVIDGARASVGVTNALYDHQGSYRYVLGKSLTGAVHLARFTAYGVRAGSAGAITAVLPNGSAKLFPRGE
ncbi:MAG: hypothetical protein IT371_11165 [Deltaproteobacteria bacterium]|nr:hypothetical protein [Deltaproteobacteria bacterium]